METNPNSVIICGKCGGAMSGNPSIVDNKICLCPKKDTEKPIPQGWQCPACKRCYPIWVRECPHCQPRIVFGTGRTDE